MSSGHHDGSTPASAPLTGRCMCGAVRFEVTRPLLGAIYCHCKRCQRRTGTAFSVSGLTEPGSMRVTAGEDVVRSWDPADGGWIKAFCGECGSQVYTTSSRRPELQSVRMGALDEDPGIRPSAHQFTDYAAPWEPLPDDGLPCFTERRPTETPPRD